MLLPSYLLPSYLSDSHQFVALNEEVSYQLQVQYGVPQVSVLGPLLFTPYMLPVNCCLSFSLKGACPQGRWMPWHQAQMCIAIREKKRRVSKWWSLGSNTKLLLRSVMLEKRQAMVAGGSHRINCQKAADCCYRSQSHVLLQKECTPSGHYFSNNSMKCRQLVRPYLCYAEYYERELDWASMWLPVFDTAVIHQVFIFSST